MFKFFYLFIFYIKIKWFILLNIISLCTYLDNVPLLQIGATQNYNLSDIEERETAATVLLGMVNYLESEGPLLRYWKDQ
jgi:hypothetical protein